MENVINELMCNCVCLNQFSLPPSVYIHLCTSICVHPSVYVCVCVSGRFDALVFVDVCVCVHLCLSERDQPVLGVSEG